MYGDNGNMYGMNVFAGDSFESTEFYQRTVFERRVFEDKMYLYPISQDEIDRNNSLVQNPGWWYGCNLNLLILEHTIIWKTINWY